MKDKQRRARAAREMAGYTVAEVARLLGKSISTIHAWEADNGACPRNLDDLISLCRLYALLPTGIWKAGNLFSATTLPLVETQNLKRSIMESDASIISRGEQ